MPNYGAGWIRVDEENENVTHYKATAVQSGEWWVVKVHDVPVNGPAVTQGHSRTEAYDMTVDLLSLLLEHTDFTVEIDFKEGDDG
jgi:hypothetical protein